MQNGTLIMIHGFEETGTKKLLEIDTCLHEMRHVKSGASLIWLEREDENKTFNITFRTTPWDDSGVFHILEHALLGGSGKVRLWKGRYQGAVCGTYEGLSEYFSECNDILGQDKFSCLQPER